MTADRHQTSSLRCGVIQGLKRCLEGKASKMHSNQNQVSAVLDNSECLIGLLMGEVVEH